MLLARVQYGWSRELTRKLAGVSGQSMKVGFTAVCGKEETKGALRREGQALRSGATSPGS